MGDGDWPLCLSKINEDLLDGGTKNQDMSRCMPGFGVVGLLERPLWVMGKGREMG